MSADDQRQLGVGGQPMFIMSEDAQRTQGRDAQTANISAGKAIAEAVRTTLGPNGMDKMLVSDGGDVVITNDGATILEEMDIEHPAAEMIVEVAEAQEDEVGDGTTTAAVLAGKLLAEAEDLLDQDVHPTTVVQGYALAREAAVETVAESSLDTELDDDTLQAVAESSMTGKGTGGITAERLAEAIVDAVREVEADGVDRDAVNVVTQSGRSSTATELIEGVIAELEPLDDAMPRSVEDAAVAVVDDDLENRETDIDVEYNVTSAQQLSDAVAAEERQLAEYAEDIVATGADVVFVTGDVADRTASRLAREGVLAFDGVDDDDANAVLAATGATRVRDVDELDGDALGAAGTVRIERFDEDEMVFVEGGAGERAITLFVRGGTGHVLDELERAVTDGVDSAVAAVKGGVVPGAGTTEIEIARAIRSTAASVEGREQLAVEAFADAVDAIPRTLAENAGMDPIDALVDLRAHNEDGRAGVIGAGRTAGIADPIENGVLDPADVKREALESATEAATMIVRIDDVISAE
ncbi:MAG: thermosome subunit alpha [Halobacteriales archaeon]